MSDEAASESLPTRLMAGLLLAATLAPLGSSMLAVALPAIAEDLQISAPEATLWLAATYLIVSMALQTPGGRIGDRIGHSRNLAVGMAVYSVAALLGYLMPTLEALVAARVAMAMGTALIVPSAMAQIRVRVGESRRGRAFGLFGGSMALAAAAGPLLGGELTQAFGWPSIFLAPLPQICIAALLLASDAPTSTARDTESRFDLVGAVLLALSMGLLVAGLGGKIETGAWAGGLGLALLAAFLVWERRAEDPLVRLELFRRRAFGAGAAVVALTNLAMYAILFQLPIYFRARDPNAMASIGRSMLALTLAMFVFSNVGARLGERLGARLGERLGARLTVSLGVVVAMLGVALLANLTAMTVPAEAMPSLALLGGGLGLLNAPNQTAVMNAVGDDEAGMAGGVYSTCRYLGGVLGISMLGRVLGDDTLDLSLHDRTSPLFLAALLVSLIAAQRLPGRSTEPQRASS